ncbi:MAG: Rpn family recombination-promoting nuclease/putative transposase [Pseudomonadales bacterium]|nr:Rpn family recombination-promoting nuclease/putative transposase [Pseudomonadales bacterium]
MKHRINPQVDCVFKAILGSPENSLVLLDFLNAILQPDHAIKSVEILNPYNEKEFLTDKLTIVDIKAQDETGAQYQIEIQISVHANLPERMVYNWADIYASQLQESEDFKILRPVIAIWLLVNNLFKDRPEYHHNYQLRDQQNRTLSSHCSLHILELNKWQLHETLTAEEHWLYFFKEAKNWDDLPARLNTPVMRQAMSTLKRFSEKEREYDQYRARRMAILEKNTIESDKKEQEQRIQELEQSKSELEQSKSELEQDKSELMQRIQELEKNLKDSINKDK